VLSDTSTHDTCRKGFLWHAVQIEDPSSISFIIPSRPTCLVNPSPTIPKHLDGYLAYPFPYVSSSDDTRGGQPRRLPAFLRDI
jgi:hypothetical protein